MEIKDILDYIVQNGIGVVCVVYMIYFQNTTMKEMLNTLKGIDTRLTIIENNMNKESKND